MFTCGSCGGKLGPEKPFVVGVTAYCAVEVPVCDVCLRIVPRYEQARVDKTASAGVTFYAATVKPRPEGGYQNRWTREPPPLFATSWTVVEKKLEKFAAKFPEEGRR